MCFRKKTQSVQIFTPSLPKQSISRFQSISGANSSADVFSIDEHDMEDEVTRKRVSATFCVQRAHNSTKLSPCLCVFLLSTCSSIFRLHRPTAELYRVNLRSPRSCPSRHFHHCRRKAFEHSCLPMWSPSARWRSPCAARRRPR